MALPQRAVGSIFHDEKGEAIFDSKIEDAHDMGMSEASNGACFLIESLFILTCKVDTQYFDGCLRIEMQVFSQVDFGKVTSPNQIEQSVVAKLLSHTVGHPPYPFWNFCWECNIQVIASGFRRGEGG